MVKASRIACVAAPLIATMGILGILIYIATAGLKVGKGTLDNRYFVMIDGSQFKIPGETSNKGLPDSQDNNVLKDVYAVYMWNYCSGTKRTDGKYNIDHCTKVGKLFNQYENWKVFGLHLANGLIDNEQYKKYIDTANKNGVNTAAAEKKSQDELKKAEQISNDTIDAATKAISFLPQATFSIYLSVLIMTVLSLIFGFVSICTRFGSICTTILSIISTLTLLVGAVGAHVLWVGISQGVNKIDFKKLGDGEAGKITSKAGTHVYTLSYIACALSLFASVFWCASICCVGTKESRREKRGAPGLGTKLGMLGTGHKYTPMQETYPQHAGGYAGMQEQGYVPQPYAGAYVPGGRI